MHESQRLRTNHRLEDAQAAASRHSADTPRPLGPHGHGRRRAAAGAAAQGLKRLARGEAPDFRGALLSAPNARRLAERLARLRGAAMKIGQLVSMQGEDMLPAEFAQALAVLRSQAAPMPPQQLQRVLGREYGRGWETPLRRVRPRADRGGVDRSGAPRDHARMGATWR